MDKFFMFKSSLDNKKAPLFIKELTYSKVTDTSYSLACNGSAHPCTSARMFALSSFSHEISCALCVLYINYRPSVLTSLKKHFDMSYPILKHIFLFLPFTNEI